MGGAAALSELDAFLSDSDFEKACNGYGGLVALPQKLFGDTGDVLNAFYQCSVAPSAEWFGLDDPVLAGLFGVTQVWDCEVQ